jgi:D-serine deaminase-like pyridoxal phosphate-dependent protein
MTLASDLETPAVTIHVDIMEDNIRRVQAHLARHGIGNRPHIKTHKIPRSEEMQMAAGAMRITCQKLGRSRCSSTRGSPTTFSDLQHPRAGKTDRLMALIRRAPGITVALDNEVVARELSEAGVRHGLDVRFLVECDTGFGRTGVQTRGRRRADAPGGPAAEDAVPRSHDVPESRAHHARVLRAGARLFAAAGIPVPVVSGGGTPTIFAAPNIPMLTEHRARHLRVQRRHGGRVRHGDLGQLRHAGARDRGEPPRRWARHPGCGHEGAHVRSVRHEGTAT